MVSKLELTLRLKRSKDFSTGLAVAAATEQQTGHFYMGFDPVRLPYMDLIALDLGGPRSLRHLRADAEAVKTKVKTNGAEGPDAELA